MSFAKTLRLLSLAIMASGAFISCRPKPVVAPDPVPLTLSAQVMSLDYEDNSLWGKKAELGVFVTESGTSNVVGESSNVRYTAEFKTGIIAMAPSDTPIILPEDGRRIDIAAYYPYSSELDSEYLYHVDLKNQKALDPELLLLAKVENRSSVLHTAMLTMRPAFAKMNVTLKNEAEVRSSESKIEVRIDGIFCEADIDILNSEYVSYGSPETTVFNGPIHASHIYEAVVLEQDIPDDAVLTVSIPANGQSDGEEVNLPLVSLMPEFKANTQYDVTVTVSPSGIEATLVGMSDIFVSDWKEDTEDINGETNN